MSIFNILRQGWYQSFKLLNLDCDASTEFLELLLLFFFQCCLGLGFRTLKMDSLAYQFFSNHLWAFSYSLWKVEICFSATICEYLAVHYGSWIICMHAFSMITVLVQNFLPLSIIISSNAVYIASCTLTWCTMHTTMHTPHVKVLGCTQLWVIH